MFADKPRIGIMIRVVLIVIVMFYELIPNAISTPPPIGQVDLDEDSDTTTGIFSTENSLFSRKELQVISLLIKGKSNKQIALQLDVCTRAVEHHLTHIYEKLGVNSRTEATIKLIHLYQI